MALKKVGGEQEIQSPIKTLGTILTRGDAFVLSTADSDVELAVFDPKTGQYYRLTRARVRVVESGDELFRIEVDVTDSKELELLA